MAGATQWKAACPHIDGRPRDVCFHSEISAANLSKWEADRLPADVGEDDLEDVLEYAGDATVAVCNSCRRVSIIGVGSVTVLHSGDPHFDDRVGEWLVDLDDDDTFGERGGR